IYLDQSAYVHRLVVRFGMQNCHLISTLLAVNHSLSVTQSPTTPDNQCAYNEYAKDINYLSLIGSLLFTTQTQPSIQFSVSLIAQFVGNLGILHLAAAKHVLCYLKGMADFQLTIGQQEEGSFDLVGWNIRKSISGFIFNIVGRSISWSSKKQSVVAMSSVEAEYITSANAMKEAIWLHTLLKELDFPQTEATTIHTDNQGYITLAGNLVSHSCAKHIDIQHHFICKCIEQGDIKLCYVPIKIMLADVFTKALPCEVFVNFCKCLGVLLYILLSGSDKK
ncbi:Copia protein, partial [Leucoagaricus sp. SymC.cos]